MFGCFRYRLDAPSKFLTSFKLDPFEDLLAQIFTSKTECLNNLQAEASAITQGTHRGGDNYWADDIPVGSDVAQVIKHAEKKILQFDPAALKSISGKLLEDCYWVYWVYWVVEDRVYCLSLLSGLH